MKKKPSKKDKAFIEKIKTIGINTGASPKSGASYHAVYLGSIRFGCGCKKKPTDEQSFSA